MGTDIHAQIEFQTKDGKWHWLLSGLDKRVSTHWVNPVNIDRNYDLFSILAGVRNGIGFASCDTGDGFNPISEPKGLPKDLSPELKKLNETDYIFGDHNFSFLDAKELSSFNWKQTTIKRGVVSKEGYKQWLLTGKKSPSQYSGGIDGKNIKTVSNAEMDDILLKEASTEFKYDTTEYFTVVSWKVEYGECLDFRTSYLLRNLMWFVEDRIGDDIINVRMVFGFDS